jgi:methyl-accepting chemotaxis protein
MTASHGFRNGVLADDRRLALYGLAGDEVRRELAAIARERPRLVPEAIDRFVTDMQSVPVIGDKFRDRRAEIAAALVSHFQIVISAAFREHHLASGVACAEALTAAGVDVRAKISAAAWVAQRYADTSPRRLGHVPRRDMERLALLNRILVYDSTGAFTQLHLELGAHATRRQQALEGAIAGLNSEIGAAVDQITGASQEATATIGSVAEMAEAALLRGRTAGALAEESNRALTHSAASTGELSLSINDLAREANLSQSALYGAEQAVDAARGSIVALQQAVEQIGSIVGLISSIAQQTNLLALNATIEAARAGESGRGFAVVAQEVKELASQTTQATTDIIGQITAVQGATERSVQAIGTIGDSMGELSRSASTVAAAVTQQGAITADLSQNLQTSVDQVVAVGEHYLEITRLVEAAAQRMEALRTSTAALVEVGGTMTAGLDSFGQRLRAI